MAWFKLTAVIFLLQWIPFTGVFLMLFLAPFWSVITVNAGFACLAIEALARPGLRLWLIAPVAYFGGYAVLAHLSQHEFTQLDTQFRASNASRSVSFNAAVHDLVITTKSDGLSGAARSLVHGYDVDRVYTQKRGLKTAGHTVSLIAARSVCDAIRQDSNARAARIYAARPKINGKRTREICMVTGPADPTRPIVSISSRRTNQNSWLLPATLNTITVRSPDGRSVELNSGHAATLPWFPMPVMGCALNSGAPSWDCHAAFFRPTKRGLGAPGTFGRANIPIIAKALGLEKISTAGLIAKATSNFPTALKANMGKRIDLSLANLKRIIADPSEKLTIHDITGLRDRTDLWRALVPQMTKTLIRAFDGGHSTRERAGMLQDLLNRLAPTEYRPVATEILAALASRPDLERRFVRRKTLARLAELGPAALPVLEHRLTFGRRGVNAGALNGLCIVGAPAAHLADKIAQPFLDTNKRRNTDQRFAAFVTLLRLGRPNLADRTIEGSRLASDAVVIQLREKITPRSGPDACVDRNTWSNRLRIEHRN
ncbi:MAG: hypothetical protein K0U74_02065 [Alphaproteobacteria bacterium]|nr:hypothetical protein [Alphaproteobacteria bacterium]